MLIDLKKLRRQINTSESYNSRVFRHKDNIILPYINLEIVGNKIVEIDERKGFVKFAYLVFTKVNKFTWRYSKGTRSYEKTCYFEDLYTPTGEEVVDFFAGGDSFEYQIGCEFEIQFDGFYLGIPIQIDLAQEPWYPISTKQVKANIPDNEVNLFFSRKTIPKDILGLLKCSLIDIDELNLGLEE
ncbi:hypothetical protein [Lewinella sp. LCG006]|uniref:hypothetical protein n=1 Tax=Lewinella sp. LCG006 TaxID=3231911 RepID=UPI003460B4C3